MMNLYLVKGTVEGYDTFESFVCAAPDEDAARRIHPAQTWEIAKKIDWNDVLERWETQALKWARIDDDWTWARETKPFDTDAWDHHIDTLTVTLLGVAVEGTKLGVICADYTHG